MRLLDVQALFNNACRKSVVEAFETKMDQAACMLEAVFGGCLLPRSPGCPFSQALFGTRCSMTTVLARIRRKSLTFLRQPWFVQVWFVPVWILLGISKALIFTVSFRRLAPRLGHRTDIAPWVPLLTPKQEQRAWMIGRLVRMTARYTPWVSNCFPQAVAARALLGLYNVPYILYFGLQRDVQDSTGMKAHAWVVAGRVPVTGGQSFMQFTVVGCFVASSLVDVAAP
ncbi:lasso peptide biosynthesis B2 protein [Thiohalocapsa marina]|nr:lasso peptide biosynthesis B2 protein [Thiohalocapsa marina]